MAIISFGQLEERLKNFLLSVAFLMPFCYYYLYVMVPDFTKNEPIQFPVVLSFCLSSVLLFLGASISLTGAIIGNASKEDHGITKHFIYGVAISIIILFLAGTFVYMFRGDIGIAVANPILFSMGILLILFIIARIKKVDKKPTGK